MWWSLAKFRNHGGFVQGTCAVHSFFAEQHDFRSLFRMRRLHESRRPASSHPSSVTPTAPSRSTLWPTLVPRAARSSLGPVDEPGSAAGKRNSALAATKWRTMHRRLDDNNWSRHAEDTLVGQKPKTARIGIDDLAASDIDWARYSLTKADELDRAARKQFRTNQQEALARAPAIPRRTPTDGRLEFPPAH